MVLFLWVTHLGCPVLPQPARPAHVSATRPAPPSGSSPALLELLRSQSRGAFELAIGRLGDLRDPRDITFLAPFLADPDVRRRREAVNTLVQIQDPAALPHLLRALHDQDNRVRATAVGGLSRFRDLRLISHWQHPDAWLRRHALRAWRAIGEPIGTPDEKAAQVRALERLNRDPNPSVRALARKPLGIPD